MPVLSVVTNQPAPAGFDDLIKLLSSETASMLGKPESYVMVMVRTDEALSFAGTNEPCAYLELKSLGLPEDQTAAYSETLCGFFEEHLSVPAERIYIEFSSPERHLFGWNRSTF